jgi:hypothetical protein
VLRALCDTLLGTPAAGAAFAPVVVAAPPRAAGDVLYALMQNALYSPRAAHAAGPTRTLPFIMGQLMLWKREALAAIGGLGCADGQLVDDMYLGRRLCAAGWKNVMSRHPLHIETGGMTLRQFWPVYRRWLEFNRNGLPLAFTWRQWLLGLELFASVAAVAVALVAGEPGAALWPALAVAALSAGLLDVARAYSGTRIALRWCWAPLLLFALAPLVLVVNRLRAQVDWRGRVYKLDGAAALAVARPTPPPASPSALRRALRAGALLIILASGLARADAPPAPAGTDGLGHPFRLDETRGGLVAVTLASRYTRHEAERVNAYFEPLAARGALHVVSVIDFMGIPSLFHGYARRRIADAARRSPIRFIVDEEGRWRSFFQARPESRVDVILIDRDGNLRGHFAGEAELAAAGDLLDHLIAGLR